MPRTRLFPPPGPAIPQVLTPETRLLVADTRTGRIHFELPFTKLTWAQKINQAGTAGATLPLEDVTAAISQQGVDNPARVIWGFVTGQFRYSLVIVYGSTVLWAGPLNPVDEIPSGPELDIGAKEFPSLLSGRFLNRLSGSGTLADPSRDVEFFRTNPRGAMYQAVAFAVNKGTGYELPIGCSDPPDMRGDSDYSYLAYDLVDTLKALQNQAAGEQGPDFRFDPYLYTTSDGEYLAYDLRLGDPYLDYGTLWTFDDTTSQVAVSADAVGMASTMYVTGSGQDREKVIGTAQSTDFIDLGFPAIEVTEGNRSSEKDQAVLDQYASAAVTAQRSPSLTWTVKSLRDGFPQAGQYRVGDLAAVDVREHRLIESGLYRSRIVALAGDDGPWVTATLSMTEDDVTTTAGG